MNVVDSSGWLEYFANGTNAHFFAPVIIASEALIVPTISMFEVFKRISAQRDEEDALIAIGMMSLGTVVDLTQEIATNAAQLSLEMKLPMADSIILQTTYTYQATLWTQDADFEKIKGVQYIEKK